MVKNCDLGLENAFKTEVTVFHHTDLPAGKQHIYILISNNEGTH